MTDDRTHRVYLIPGMFGFGKLAGYDYFVHLEHALARAYRRAGVELSMHVVGAPPTASISERARVLARTLAATAGGDGPIHLVGHSTGGLDARLLLSPGRQIELSDAQREAVSRVQTLVTLNCPHHGTPLAGYFTSVAGTRMLYALSLLTVTSLSIGRLPLTAFSGLVAAVGAVDEKLGVDIHLIDQLTEYVLRFVGDRGRDEIHNYLEHVRDDRGGIIHLMPEVMELFNAAVGDHPDVRYGSVVSAAPAPGPRRLLSAVLSPFGALNLAVYSTVYGVASRADGRYPYARPTRDQRHRMAAALGRPPRPEMVDGIVPTLSMLWSEVLWCGEADHLDIVGHFDDGGLPRTHVDWLQSGAHFNRRDFQSMTDAVAGFQLR